MTPLVFWYAHDQGGDHIASTPEEIDAALDLVANLADDGEGVAATIVRDCDEKGILYAGFNGDVGALYYAGVGEGFYSQGDVTQDVESLSYALQQNELEFPPNGEVPIAVVRAAVHEFARTGARPTEVRWQEWQPPYTPGSSAPDPFDSSVWGD